MEDVFCKIVKKESTATIDFEDEVCLGILDIHPETKGHTLIIPKTHYADVHDMPEEVFAHICKMAKKRADELYQDYTAVTIAHNTGTLRDVDHFHMHICGFKGTEKNNLATTAS